MKVKANAPRSKNVVDMRAKTQADAIEDEIRRAKYKKEFPFPSGTVSADDDVWQHRDVFLDPKKAKKK